VLRKANKLMVDPHPDPDSTPKFNHGQLLPRPTIFGRRPALSCSQTDRSHNKSIVTKEATKNNTSITQMHTAPSTIPGPKPHFDIDNLHKNLSSVCPCLLKV